MSRQTGSSARAVRRLVTIVSLVAVTLSVSGLGFVQYQRNQVIQWAPFRLIELVLRGPGGPDRVLTRRDMRLLAKELKRQVSQEFKARQQNETRFAWFASKTRCTLGAQIHQRMDGAVIVALSACTYPKGEPLEKWSWIAPGPDAVDARMGSYAQQVAETLAEMI